MTELLKVDGLVVKHGDTAVLDGVGFRLSRGHVLSLIGGPGSGKTTLLNTLAGITRHSGGTIFLDGYEIGMHSPSTRSAVGLGWIPPQRSIFRAMTVWENLKTAARPGPWTERQVFDTFPKLYDHRLALGTSLSLLEVQMLAVARTLLANPRLLLLDDVFDEDSQGVARDLLAAIAHTAKEEGLTAIVAARDAQRLVSPNHDAACLQNGAMTRAAVDSSPGAGSAMRGMLEPLIRSASLVHES